MVARPAVRDEAVCRAAELERVQGSEWEPADSEDSAGLAAAY